MRKTINLRRVLSVFGFAACVAIASPAVAQAPIAAAEAADLMGVWAMTLQTPDGDMPMVFSIGDEGGNLVVRLGGSQGLPIPNVRLTGERIVTRSQIDYQGAPLSMEVTLSRQGEGVLASWNFGDGLYTTSSTGTRQ